MKKPAAAAPCRVALATLGCKVNQYDSAALAQALAEAGFAVVPFGEAAEVTLVNTCTVTGRSDFQGRQMVRRGLRRNPDAPVIVTGCYAETQKAALAVEPGVAAVWGNRDKGRIVVRLAAWRDEGLALSEPETAPPDPFFCPPVTSFPDHTRAFLKIQDGCNSFCSYCIVPAARGRSRSLPMAAVLDRIASLGAAGYQEVVLTGVHLGIYGADLTPASSLAAVVDAVDRNRWVPRLRISSVEPREVTDDLLALLREGSVLCPHLHIPFQSGDDGILARMNRKDNTAFYRRLVDRILAARFDAAIGGDILTGFPGEDEAAFETTLRFLESLPLAYLHVFPYSRRPGTPAAAMPDQVREDVKKARAARLRALAAAKKAAYLERQVGRRLSVLLEAKADRTSGACKGLAENYVPVRVADARPEEINTILSVVVEAAADGMATARRTA